MNDDAVLRRRAQFDKLATLLKRVGWVFVAVSVAAFVVGMATSFDPWGTIVVVALAGSTLTLAPGIVLGYAVRAAERDERPRP